MHPWHVVVVLVAVVVLRGSGAACANLELELVVFWQCVVALLVTGLRI